MNTEKSRSTLNVLFYIKKQKLLKTGEAPICMRVTINKRKQEIMVKRSIPVELWDQKKESSKGKDRAAKELNHYLDTTKAKILAIHHDLLEEGLEVTAESVRDRFYGRDSSKHTLLTIYAEQNRKCRELIGRDYAESTVKKFDTAINRLREFITERFHKEDVPLDKVTGEFIRDFDFWLKTERKMQNNSALKHLKELKKVMRIALANGWIKKDPFYGIRLRRDEVNVEFLSREELETLINKKFSIQRLEQVRDVFVFCSFTGLAFIDVLQLKKEHLIKDNQGALWIRKARQKTHQMSNIPVLTPARKLIEKYADNPECIEKDVLLPVISNQKMNAYLKEIADLCGISKRLTTHVARHTAATVVFLANEVSMENVAKILGHANIKMTQHYAKVLDSSIMRDMKKVEMNFSKAL